MSLVFSNVPGPKTPFVFTGAECTKMMFMVPGLASIATGISIISHVDTFKIGCISDLAYVEYPQEVIDIFERNFDK
jgi:hypothetical protein